MEIIEQNSNGAVVRLSLNEMVMLNNSLNEVLHGIEVPEFQTHIGYSEAEARQLLTDFHPFFDELK